MMNQKTIWVFALVFFVAVFGIGLYYFQLPDKEKVYTTAFNEGRDLFRQGDTGRSLYKYEDALRNASTKEEEAIAKINIGAAFLADKPAEGIATLRALSEDEEVSGMIRATAVFYVMSWYGGHQDPVFARDNIFVGQVWGNFWDSARPEITVRNSDDAARRAMEYASSLYALPALEYGIAILQGYEWQNSDVSAAARNALAEQALGHIRNGDTELKKLLDEIQSRRLNPAEQAGRFASSNIVTSYLWKGIAQKLLYDIKKITSPAEVEANFQELLDFVEKYPTVSARAATISARLEYASFIAKNDVGRIADIPGILAPIYELYKQYPAFAGFETMANQRSGSRAINTVYKANLLLLARIDPAFKGFLQEKLGWTNIDFTP